MTANGWKRIQEHEQLPLSDLFAKEPDRLTRLTQEVAGIYFDWSKTHLDRPLVEAFVELADDAGFAAARDALFAGAIVNTTEGRSVTHPAERGHGDAEAVDLATSRRLRMRALVDAVEAGAFGTVTAILHIGIGGSALGPALVVDALGSKATRLQVSFLSNIDGTAFDRAVEALDPATTLIVAVSKSFNTSETRANLAAALAWLEENGVADAEGRVIAVTAAPQAALGVGIDETRILQFPESVGGRYSLWSAPGISAALALGWDAFEELLEGAAEMDRHFRFTPAEQNGPLIAAFSDQLYVRRGAQSRAVFAYDERLRLLPPYLQQVEMESNGKSVTLAGEPVDWWAPVTWGGVGTDAQHAVFQLLHQGTVPVPVEFVAVAEDESSLPDHHHQLLLNAFAQGAALMRGKQSDDPHRSYPGNRPSSTVLLERLDARTLGALLAFYEHRTFANAVLMGINPFDQFGVELGKEMARDLGGQPAQGDLDASTRALIERAGL